MSFCADFNASGISSVGDVVVFNLYFNIIRLEFQEILKPSFNFVKYVYLINAIKWMHWLHFNIDPPSPPSSIPDEGTSPHGDRGTSLASHCVDIVVIRSNIGDRMAVYLG